MGQEPVPEHAAQAGRVAGGIKLVSRPALIESWQDAVRMEGGNPVVTDAGLLDAALARPAQVLADAPEEATVFTLAAALASGIIGNHPFLDGNKRAAFIAAMMMLHINGFSFDVSETEAAEMFDRLADRKLGEDALARIFKQRSFLRTD